MYSGGPPDGNADVRGFIDALHAVIDERRDDVCCIAGVDLSHVGQRFGQNISISPALLKQVEAEDRSMMQHVLDQDAERFFRLIQCEKDRRNVCGVPAIYTLLRLMKGGSSRLQPSMSDPIPMRWVSKNYGKDSSDECSSIP